MRRFRIVIGVIVCFWFLVGSCWAQPAADPFEEYQQFLDEHKDMDSPELLAMFPAGNFQEDVGLPWESVVHHDLIDKQYNLTAYERTLLEKNGFVVTERLRQDSFLQHLLQIWREDQPLFISTDAILHAVHYYYDIQLQDIETAVLRGRLIEMLEGMHARVPELFDGYGQDAELQVMFQDVDLYLTVARRLLGQTSATPHVADPTTVHEVLALIEAENLATYPLFTETCRQIDFSQFTPRGHYTKREALRQYFQAMMWLGRIELYLLAPENTASLPCPPPTAADLQRQTIDAVLLLELMGLAEVDDVYAEIETVLSSLVGQQDNVTVAQLRSVLGMAAIANAQTLLDTGAMEAFQEALAEQAFASQRILSQVLMHDPWAPESIQPASAFLLFGQRFVIDSYITGNVVYDKITYKDEFICRLFPSTLDVLGGLGNNLATELLQPKLDEYHYVSNLAALRYLVDGHDATFWDSSFYNLWLNSIRTLNPPANRDHLPAFMQTAAWWHQKMNTQLSSWIELRHDNLLYAKQSYTSGYACSYPCAYVEPFPEFFEHLNHLAVAAHEMFSGLTFSGTWQKDYVLAWFQTLGDVTETLGTIAQKELDGTPLTEDEITFMKQMLYTDGYGTLDGWYMQLLYNDSIATDPVVSTDYLMADYHTTPTDCAGFIIGAILHGGTGPVDLAIVTAQAPESERAAFVGPVMNYYEYMTFDFQRLTDEQWHATYLQQASRPMWTASYLADEAGVRTERRRCDSGLSHF